MAGITSTLRFPSKINKNLRKLGINFVPYKRLNFLMAGFGPLLRRDYKLIR
jgi:tubulin beta